MIKLAGVPFSFNYRTYDSQSGLFFAAKIYDVTGGSPVLVSQVPMPEIGTSGLYVGKFTGTAGKIYEIDKLAFTDGSYTVIDGGRSPGTESVQMVAIASEVWDAPAASYVVADSMGFFMNLIKTVAAMFSFDTGRVIAKAEVVSDKTNYTLTNSDKANIADRVWDEDLSGHTAAGSAGKALQDIAAVNNVSYVNRMSVSYSNASSLQELIAWAEKDGQRVLAATACTVTVKDADGNTAWTATLASPNADGIFKFTQSFVPSSNKNYYVVIQITVDAAVRTTQQPFFTVG